MQEKPAQPTSKLRWMKRLLFRLWLAMPNSRPLPESYKVLFGHTEPGALRGGIRPPKKTCQLPL